MAKVFLYEIEEADEMVTRKTTSPEVFTTKNKAITWLNVTKERMKGTLTDIDIPIDTNERFEIRGQMKGTKCRCRKYYEYRLVEKNLI